VGGHVVTAAYSGDGTRAPSSAFVGVVVHAAAASVTSTTVYSYTIGYAGNGNVTSYTDSVNGTWRDITYNALNRHRRACLEWQALSRSCLRRISDS